MTADTTTDAHRLNRLRFRAWRRGFSELDLIMGGFVDRHGAELTDAEFSEFEGLLDLADQDVYAWLIGQTPTPANLDTPLMRRLKAFRPTPA